MTLNMYYWEAFCCVSCLLYISTHSAKLAKKSVFSIHQFDGLDELYQETQESAPVTPHYALVKTVCNRIRNMDSFLAITNEDTNNSHSKIRGELTKVRNTPLYVTDSGSCRYKFETNANTFIIDLYPCTEPNTSNRKYALSHGYKHDTLFFLFVIDDTNTAELKGLVKRDRIEGGSNIVKKHREKQTPESDLQGNPLCDLNGVQKFQACLLLLNTPYYRNKYILALSLDNINQKCKRIVLETSDGTQEAIETSAFPCWVKPVSNPWIKIFNMPNESSRPLYLLVDYKNLKVNTFRTVEVGEEFDIVHFDANLKSLLLKDLFFIFDGVTATLKSLSGIKSNNVNGRC